MTGARRLAMFPLSTVLFPHAPLPLHVFEPRYRAMTEHCLSGESEFGVVLIDRGSEVGGGDHRVGVGTVAQIREAARLPDGRWVLIAEGCGRIRVEGWLSEDPFPMAMVTDLEGDVAPSADALSCATASVRRSRALLSELGQSPAPASGDAQDAADPAEQGWRLCWDSPLTLLDRQRLLETEDPDERMRVLAELTDELSADLTRMLADGGSSSGPDA